MMMKRLFLASLVALAMAGGAAAQSDPAKLGLGDHAPKPEKVGKLGNDIFIRARLVREKSGELAGKVKRGEIIALHLDFLPAEGAKDRPISLICSAQFIDVAGDKSDSSVDSKICRDGRLQDSSGYYSGLAMPLRFRPEASDPAGTHGVVVTVEDSFSGKKVVLVPTYEWVDGKK
jgi:hypothetical protein